MEYKSLTFVQLTESIQLSPRFKNKDEHSIADELQPELEAHFQRGNIRITNNADDDQLFTVAYSWISDRTEMSIAFSDCSPLFCCALNALIIRENLFFTILMNPQKTKTAQIIRRISLFFDLLMEQRGSHVVPIIFIRNDLEQKDQMVSRFLCDLVAKLNVTIFIMASGLLKGVPSKFEDRVISNPRPQEILNHLRAYARGEAGMPLFISLPNKTQSSRVLSVYEFARKNPKLELKPMTFLDEADEIYPLLRPKLLPFLVEDPEFTNGLVTPTPFNGGAYFVTATIGPIKELPEVVESDQMLLDIEGAVTNGYRSLAHEDSIVPLPTLHQRNTESNREFANRVVRDAKDHFFSPVTGRNGISHHRRILIVADYENAKQVALGRDLAELGASAIVINQTGFTLIYKDERGQLSDEIKEKSKGVELAGKPMNEKLIFLFKKYPFLRDRPLFIVGNRKVDRAITYHYAPRAPVDSAWEPAFLLTDFICGYLDALAKAVQAYGRMFGVIGHHPDYCGRAWYWVDSRTREKVMRQIRIVSAIEAESYTYQPMVALYSDAEAVVPEVEAVYRRDIRETPICTTLAEITRTLEANFGGRVSISTDASQARSHADGFHLSGRLTQHWGKYGHSGKISDQTKDHRLVMKRLRPEEGPYPMSYTEVALTTSVIANSQPYVIIPIYSNEDSLQGEVRYIARYEEPLRDQVGQVIREGDKVTFEGHVYLIDKIHYSKDGEPSKAVLGDGKTSLKIKQVERLASSTELLLADSLSDIHSLPSESASSGNVLVYGSTASVVETTEYSRMKRPELIALCKERDINGISRKTKKQELVTLLNLRVTHE